MKTRKLFAILTLVAFMMTLLPMAAFAADASSASKISLNASSKPANDSSTVEVTVALRGADNKPATSMGGNNLFIWAERASDALSDVDVINTVVTDVYTSGDAGDNYIMFDNTGVAEDGIYKVKFSSKVAGDVTFKAALANTTNINDVVGESQYLIGSQNFEWRQLGVSNIVLKNIDPAVEATDKNDPDAFTYYYEGFEADGTEYKLTFVVEDSEGAPLAGEKVEFALNKRGAHLNKTEDTSDVLGEVDVKVYAYEADDYKLTVKRGNKVTVVNMDFGGSKEPFEIEAATTITDKVALDSSPTIEFKVFDVFGNRILKGTGTGESEDDTGLYYVAFVIEDDDDVVFSKKPSASDLEDEDISVVVDGNVLSVDFARDIDVAGTYEVKVKLPNGKFDTVSFEAAEQGNIGSMVLDIKESYLAYGSTSSNAKVKYYDNNNVFYEDTNLATVELSVSNTSLATIEDRAVKAKDAAYNNFNSGKVVVTAIDTARGLVANDEITIGSLVAGLEVTTPEDATLLTETAEITYQLVNQDGDPIAFDATNKAQIDVDAYVVSQPADANVDINLPLKSDYQNSLSRTGAINVNVESEEAGNVTIAFVVKGQVPDGADGYDDVTLSNTVEVKFVAERVALGAENVTLFIGATGYVVDGQPMQTDLAPFVQDGRTFVPVRVVGEALGAEVEWDAATQTVTLVREDVTITMTIGSNELTISDGTVVVSDAAPFIAEGNRTVLPFRAIAEAFGAEVEAIFAADGTTAAVQFMQ